MSKHCSYCGAVDTNARTCPFSLLDGQKKSYNFDFDHHNPRGIEMPERLRPVGRSMQHVRGPISDGQDYTHAMEMHNLLDNKKLLEEFIRTLLKYVEHAVTFFEYDEGNDGSNWSRFYSDPYRMDPLEKALKFVAKMVGVKAVIHYDLVPQFNPRDPHSIEGPLHYRKLINDFLHQIGIRTL